MHGAQAGSLPLRERGLKSGYQCTGWRPGCVAPLAGAWIEIEVLPEGQTGSKVAPLAGAWIEIIWYRTKVDGSSGRSPCGSVD